MAERTVRRVNLRLMPYLFLLYVVAYLDRVNIGYAGLQMTRELGFSNAVFGLGGGIFYLGYMLLEIPGGVLAEVWSARKWIARILLTWGFIASATGLIHSVREFYWLRFFLGLGGGRISSCDSGVHQPLVSSRGSRQGDCDLHGLQSRGAGDWRAAGGHCS